MVMSLGQGADLYMAQLMPLPLTISCSSKSRLVLPFWCRLTRVVPDKIQEGRKTVVCVNKKTMPPSCSGSKEGQSGPPTPTSQWSVLPKRIFECNWTSGMKIYWLYVGFVPTNQFLADRTIGRAFGTVSRLSVCLSVCLSSVCRLWRFVLWQNGAS